MLILNETHLDPLYSCIIFMLKKWFVLGKEKVLKGYNKVVYNNEHAVMFGYRSDDVCTYIVYYVMNGNVAPHSAETDNSGGGCSE